MWNGRIFRDRADAGRRLAERLAAYAARDDVTVLALPRGGVPVAYEVARALGAPLDVLVVRKLGVPGYEELAMGALASGGVRVLNPEVVRQLRIPPQVIEAQTARESDELDRRERLYRGDRPPLDVGGRTVIVVDDGIATGATLRAGIRALRELRPARIVVAAPAGAAESCRMLAAEADEVVCLQQPDPFLAVAGVYASFPQTSDAEVRSLLERAAAWAPAGRVA